MQNRKEFLKTTAGALGAFAITPAFANFFNSDEEAAKKIKKFGLQLWSVRDDMAKDAAGTIAKLAQYGYKQIESFGGPKGIFWGMTAKEWGTLLSNNGLKMISTHCADADAVLEKTAADAASIGMEYIIYPWEGPGKTIDDYKKMADDFNKRGEICRKNGIKYAFHNHDYTFKKIGDVFAQDILMQNTDANLVSFEMDIYWVVTAGQDPIEWLKKYPNRFMASHIKDREVGVTTNDASCILGNGTIDFKKILKVAKQNGMQYFNVEQEKWTNTNPMDAAKANAAFMKKLKL